MQGGTISSGRRCTFGVDGAYWISSISALRYTTSPGVIARLRPTAKARASLIEMRPTRASAARFDMPCARLAPSVATARFSTSGFVAGKFDGAIASTNWRVAKVSRCFCCAGSGASAGELGEIARSR